MREKPVAIIVIHYNSWADTVEALESIFRLQYPDFWVLVIDNSGKNDGEKILSWSRGDFSPWITPTHPLRRLIFPPIKKPCHFELYHAGERISLSRRILIKSARNLGFAGAANLGLRSLWDTPIRYFWILNNDLLVTPDCLSKLVDFVEKEKLGLAGTALYEFEDPTKVQSLGGRINRIFGSSKDLKRPEELPEKLDYIVGASLFITRETLEKIGFLAEDYFLYYEDTDYSFRARAAGIKIGVCKEAAVYHKGNKSRKPIKVKSIVHRNRILFYRRHINRYQNLGLLPSFLAYYGTRFLEKILSLGR